MSVEDRNFNPTCTYIETRGCFTKTISKMRFSKLISDFYFFFLKFFSCIENIFRKTINLKSVLKTSFLKYFEFRFYSVLLFDNILVYSTSILYHGISNGDTCNSNNI